MKINQPTPRPNNDDLSLRLHKAYRGKIQTIVKCPLTSQADLAVWYTPGVAAPSRAIYRNPWLAYDYTNKGNTVAVVSDGSRVLIRSGSCRLPEGAIAISIFRHQVAAKP